VIVAGVVSLYLELSSVINLISSSLDFSSPPHFSLLRKLGSAYSVSMVRILIGTQERTSESLCGEFLSFLELNLFGIIF
jgi:hypothetical protein